MRAPNRRRLTDVEQQLVDVAARYQVGGLVNAIDEAGKPSGHLPASAYRAAMALHVMLADLGLTDAGSAQVADVWRPV